MSVADFSGCLLPFSECVKVRRALPVALENGRRQSTQDSEVFDIYASVQPMPTKEQQALPEGLRNLGAVTVYTDFVLGTVDTAETRVADVLIADGIEYSVHAVDNWITTANYVKAVCVRLPT